MATFSKIPLSQSSFGKSVQLTLSATPGTLIHTTGTLSANIDEIWLYASNVSTVDSNTTFYWGSTAQQDIIAQINVQAYSGLTLIMPGAVLGGNNVEGAVIYATTQYPSAVNVVGYVNRITA